MPGILLKKGDIFCTVSVFTQTYYCEKTTTLKIPNRETKVVTLKRTNHSG